MEENLSENYEELLNKINNVLVKSNKLNNHEKKVEFLKENEAYFEMLKNSINDIANSYLIKESDNTEQNKISEILKSVIIQLLRNEEVFKEQKTAEDYKAMIVNMLCHYENRLMFRLRHSDEIKFMFECLEYQQDREAYIRAIKNNRMIQNNYGTERAIRNYINDSYERIMFENMIRIIKDDHIVINKNKSKKLIKQVDSLDFIGRILKKEEQKLQTTEKWILQRYADTLIPLKANVYPESLEHDRLVVAFLNGRIKNEKLYLQIANAIPIDEFESLIFAINLKNTSRIIREVKLGNLSEDEKAEVNRLLEKAGIKVNKKKEEPPENENYLVNLQELRICYEEATTEEIYNEKAKFYKANISETNGKNELTSQEKRTYKEVSVIIRMMTKKMRDKISPKFIEFIERNKAKKGSVDIDKNKTLQSQKLRHETRILLALIFRDYMCSEEERKQLIKNERMAMAKKETEQPEGLVVVKELKWYQRIVISIKKVLNNKNNV